MDLLPSIIGQLSEFGLWPTADTLVGGRWSRLVTALVALVLSGIVLVLGVEEDLVVLRLIVIAAGGWAALISLVDVVKELPRPTIVSLLAVVTGVLAIVAAVL